MIIHLYIPRVNHPQTKTNNELDEAEHNNFKLRQNGWITNLIIVYLL